MAGNVMSFPFGGQICYQTEANYLNGMDYTGSTTTYRISDAVTDIRLDTGDVNTTLRTVSSPSITDFSRTMADPTLHIEWVFQPNTLSSFEELCVNRNACDLNSLAFMVGANICSGTSDAYYHLKGCKCKTFNISASQGENWICTADFSVASVITSSSTASVGSFPATAIGTTYAAFNIAGSITYTGPTTPYVTNSVDITVENNINDYYDVGGLSKKAAIPGGVDVTGSCDISLDSGASTQWSEFVGGTDITSIAFNTGCKAGDSGTITLHNGRFDSGSIDLNTSGEGLIGSIPFTFKYLKFTTGT